MFSTGLVLEGGGMRGAYTAGVLDAFLDYGIHFKDILGVSAGAANALSYISLQHGRNKELYKRFAPDDKYLSFKSFLKTGSFLGMEYVFFEVPKKHLPFDYKAFRESDKKLTIVATNVLDGKAFYKELTDVEQDAQMHYICASAAIPVASTMFNTEGNLLMDGGMSDSIPIEHSINKGNTKNVVVLTRNKGYRAKKSAFSNFAYIRYPKYKSFARTVANRFYQYNKTLDFLTLQEEQGNALVLRPSKPIEASRFEKNPDKLLALYQNGYDDAIKISDKLKKFVYSSSNVDIKST